MRNILARSSILAILEVCSKAARTFESQSGLYNYENRHSGPAWDTLTQVKASVIVAKLHTQQQRAGQSS